MTPEMVRQIIKEELEALIKSDRYTVHKRMQFLDKVDIDFAAANGTKIGTVLTQKLAFYGLTPIIQQSSTGETTGASDLDVQYTTTFTGNNGSTAYTILDIVKHLKNYGLLLK